MTRPTVEVADLLRTQGDRFVTENRSWLSYQQLKVLRAIQRCRTPALGGHSDQCSGCGHSAISFNSCRNRHCPKCQAQARQRWRACREQELLGLSYFHVVFTLPHELNRLCQRNPALLYNLLFRSVAETLLEVAADPQHLGAEIGFLAILHTWGQNLMLHPHLRCLVPVGGLSPEHRSWLRPRYRFFLPIGVLKKVFRGKFLDGLKRAYRRRKLSLGGATAPLKDPKAFRALLQSLHRKNWVVYVKPAMSGPKPVLRYLGRYTHRVAISNHRLVSFDGEQVTFRWKDYAHGNKQRLMTLSATEFLRRYVQHVLPHGFVRIRQFGFLANRHRSKSIAAIRHLLASETHSQEPSSVTSCEAKWQCPCCGNLMQIGCRLTARRGLLIMRTTRYFLKQSITIDPIPCLLARSQSCVSGRHFQPLISSVCFSRPLMAVILSLFGPTQPAFRRTPKFVLSWNSTKGRLNLHTRHAPPAASF